MAMRDHTEVQTQPPTPWKQPNLVFMRETVEWREKDAHLVSSKLKTSSPRTPASFTRRLIQHFSAPVHANYYAELQLLLLTFATGIQDATSFPDYHCFTSNQTGNTIMLPLSVIMPQNAADSRTAPFVTANIAVSLPFFLLGAHLTGQIGNMSNNGHRLFSPQCRAWLFAVNLLQTLLVLTAAALQHQSGIHLSGGTSTLIIIALLAFASGSQVVMSRILRMTEISTAMATAAWVDLLVDPHLFCWRTANRPRNRRVLFLVALVAGCFAGAAGYVKIGSEMTLVLSAVVKGVVTLMFCFEGGVSSSSFPASSDSAKAEVVKKGVGGESV